MHNSQRVILSQKDLIMCHCMALSSVTRRAPELHPQTRSAGALPCYQCRWNPAQ